MRTELEPQTRGRAGPGALCTRSLGAPRPRSPPRRPCPGAARPGSPRVKPLWTDGGGAPGFPCPPSARPVSLLAPSVFLRKSQQEGGSAVSCSRGPVSSTAEESEAPRAGRRGPQPVNRAHDAPRTRPRWTPRGASSSRCSPPATPPSSDRRSQRRDPLSLDGGKTQETPGQPRC